MGLGLNSSVVVGGDSGLPNVTLGYSAYPGSALGELTFTLGNFGNNTLSFVELGGSATSVIINGSASDPFVFSGYTGSLSITATLADAVFTFDDVSPGATFTCPNGVASLTWSGTTNTTTITFAGITPATISLNELFAPYVTTLIFSGNIPAGTTLSWNFSGQSISTALKTYLLSQQVNIVGGFVNMGGTAYINSQVVSEQSFTGGTAYSTGTSIATTNGTGTGCTIDILSVNEGTGEITSLIINQRGSGYTQGDVLGVDGGDANAQITVNVGNYDFFMFNINTGCSVTFVSV